MADNLYSVPKFEDTLFPLKKTLQSKGNLYLMEEPWVMGILNITPDSFYKKSRISPKNSEIIEKAGEMLGNGAKILDIGGYSTRPGASALSVKEELNRVIPVITIIREVFPHALLSIDTFRHQVAEIAIQSGADIVNDISGGELDPKMIRKVGELGAPYICMHMRGNPQNMQELTHYDNLEKELLNYFSEKQKACREAGIKDVILDVGFGFAKNLEQNYKLLKNLSLFSQLGMPVLVGISRKSMIYKLLGTDSDEALNGTTAAHTIALVHGASILRVHDVKAAKEAIDIYKKVYA
ncbi:dihydropteroate synthase [Pleomorphovibrio marinus]|uniref:dihydropteroate synthase n=1 Tax=Pleomorphovibrio marinus TaxID=2164132 RepID=UPI000E0BB031|nr:dihydropteroate synthase [Pleomorphovibrio marinus]